MSDRVKTHIFIDGDVMRMHIFDGVDDKRPAFIVAYRIDTRIPEQHRMHYALRGLINAAEEELLRRLHLAPACAASSERGPCEQG